MGLVAPTQPELPWTKAKSERRKQSVFFPRVHDFVFIIIPGPLYPKHGWHSQQQMGAIRLGASPAQHQHLQGVPSCPRLHFLVRASPGMGEGLALASTPGTTARPGNAAPTSLRPQLPGPGATACSASCGPSP